MTRLSNEINVGDRWKRVELLGDAYDEVVVTGKVDHAGFRPDEWSIASATDDFGPTVQTTADGILDFCELVTSGRAPEEDWV
jgi:hypothetical protein